MSLKMIYTTDLHGDIKKYQDVLKTAESMGVSLIHLGADLLPKGRGMLKEQKHFVKSFLRNYYDECRAKGIDVLSFFGNDDIGTRRKYFREYAPLLDEQPFEKDGFIFEAYGQVPDHPFGFKGSCKLDHKGWVRPETVYGDPVLVTEEGIVDIHDLDKHYAELSTIEDDLKAFKGGRNSIMAIHTPPWALGLDVCGRRPNASEQPELWVPTHKVGSKAVFEWIREKNPLLVLCGHIHESPWASGAWSGMLGNTLVVQPGQLPGKTSMVHIEVNGRVDAKRIEV